MGGVQAWRDSEKRKFDRVHGMGEFAEKETTQEDDDEDCEFDSQGEELPEDEAEWRKSEKRRIRKEREEAMEGEGDVVDTGDGDGDGGEKKEMVWQEPGQDDDVSVHHCWCVAVVLTSRQEFTVDMMLRSLNIDLDVIGYDKVGRRWVA